MAATLVLGLMLVVLRVSMTLNLKVGCDPSSTPIQCVGDFNFTPPDIRSFTDWKYAGFDCLVHCGGLSEACFDPCRRVCIRHIKRPSCAEHNGTDCHNACEKTQKVWGCLNNTTFDDFRKCLVLFYDLKLPFKKCVLGEY